MYHRYGSEQGGFSEYLRRHYAAPQHNHALEDMDDYDSPEENELGNFDNSKSVKQEFFLFQLIRDLFQKKTVAALAF